MLFFLGFLKLFTEEAFTVAMELGLVPVFAKYAGHEAFIGIVGGENDERTERLQRQ